MIAPSRNRRGLAWLSVCGLALLALCSSAKAAEEPAHSAELDAAIIASAKRHGVPERLVRRVVMRESRYNPRARNHRYWGLMQISYPTARSMGFRGTPDELLNPVTNLTYAVPYLANAFIAAGRREDAAVRLYAAGYYDTARQRGLLGLLRTADSTPVAGGNLPSTAAPEPAQGASLFGTLTGTNPPPAPQPQLAYAEAAGSASAAQVQIQAVAPAQSAVAAGDKAAGPVDMVADKKGDLAPPKKWLRDGGRTVMARGEQPIDAVHAATGDDGKRKSAHRSRKTTVFAEIDSAPASPQAYAATADQQPAPQSAVAEASQQRPTYAPVPENVAAADPAAAQPAPDATPLVSTRKGRTATRTRSKTAHAKKSSGTKVAEHIPDTQPQAR